jgi:hypothetical protein
MEVIVLDSAAFDALKQEFKGLVKQALAELLEEKKTEAESDWITLQDAKKLLPFKSKTSWQKIRDNGEIKFTQFGRKILYSRKSIYEFLNNNKIKF